jgi:hypothetical protein
MRRLLIFYDKTMGSAQVFSEDLHRMNHVRFRKRYEQMLQVFPVEEERSERPTERIVLAYDKTGAAGVCYEVKDTGEFSGILKVIVFGCINIFTFNITNTKLKKKIKNSGWLGQRSGARSMRSGAVSFCFITGETGSPSATVSCAAGLAGLARARPRSRGAAAGQRCPSLCPRGGRSTACTTA